MMAPFRDRRQRRPHRSARPRTGTVDPGAD